VPKRRFEQFLWLDKGSSFVINPVVIFVALVMKYSMTNSLLNRVICFPGVSFWPFSDPQEEIFNVCFGEHGRPNPTSQRRLATHNRPSQLFENNYLSPLKANSNDFVQCSELLKA